MNAMVPGTNNMANINPAALPASIVQAMQGMQSSELSENVGGNIAVISIRGKVFRIKHGGNEIPLMANFNGTQVPSPYFDVVIPAANGALSKTYYINGYAEGSDAPPDCWSEDGHTPLAPLAKRPMVVNGMGQAVPCTDCRTCPMNAFGSKINQATGKQAKACSDNRKLVMLPAHDLVNEQFGGGMLFRVPAASLGALAEYDARLRSMGIPFIAAVTRIAFDQSVAYPKLTFEVVRLITDSEATQVMAVRNDPRTKQMLEGQSVAAPEPPQQLTAPAAQPQTQQQAVAQYAPVPPQYQQAQPVMQPQVVPPQPQQAPQPVYPQGVPQQTQFQQAPVPPPPPTQVLQGQVIPAGQPIPQPQMATFAQPVPTAAPPQPVAAPAAAQAVPGGIPMDPAFFNNLNALINS